jgi:phasin family protein
MRRRRVSAQAIAKLQAEFARETAEELSKVTKELITYGSVEDKFAKQAGATKEAFETVAANVNELAKLVQQSRAATFEVICERVIESFDEVQAAFEPKPTKRARIGSRRAISPLIGSLVHSSRNCQLGDRRVSCR